MSPANDPLSALVGVPCSLGMSASPTYRMAEFTVLVTPLTPPPSPSPPDAGYYRSPGIMLLIFQRSANQLHVPLKILNIETGEVGEDVGHVQS